MWSLLNSDRWILFGAEVGAGFLTESHYYLYQAAPPDLWSRQQIDLGAIYDRLDWGLPPIQRVVRGDLELLLRMVTVKLIVAARDQQEASEVSGTFGPLGVDQGPNPIRDRVAETVENKAEYYASIADLKLKRRNYADASSDYYEALSTDPEHLPAYFGLGESLFWQGDYEGAADAYRRALEDPGQQALAYKGLAWAKFNLGEYEVAERYFQDSIRLGIHPPLNLADSYNGLGWVYLRLGECQEAIRYFEQSLVIAPDFQDPVQGIETCRASDEPN